MRLDEELKKESIKLDIWGAGMGIEDVRTEIGIHSETGFQAFADKWMSGRPKVSHMSQTSRPNVGIADDVRPRGNCTRHQAKNLPC